MTTDDLIKKEIRKILKKHQEHGVRYAVDELFDLISKIKDEAKREAIEKVSKQAIEKASKKLSRLRLTDVFGEKDIPQETVKSVFQRGLGGLYDDEAIVYVLRFGIKYYLDSLKEDGGEGK